MGGAVTMENVRNIVDGVLEQKGWSGKVLEQMAVELWPEVVGDTIARHTLAEKFKTARCMCAPARRSGRRNCIFTRPASLFV
jgi:predicted nucleic acid-binding Zn ribbon protein